MSTLTRRIRLAAEAKGWSPIVQRWDNKAALMWPRNKRPWPGKFRRTDAASVVIEVDPHLDHEAVAAALIDKAEQQCAALGFDPIAGDFLPQQAAL